MTGPTGGTATTSRRPVQARSWLASNWGALLALIVALGVVIATIGAIRPEDSAKIRVLAANHYLYDIDIILSIDDITVKNRSLGPGNYLGRGENQTVGEWSLEEGLHIITIDRGWWYPDGWPIENWTYKAPDGAYEFRYEHHFEPGSTQTIYVSFGHLSSSITWVSSS